MGLVMMQKVFLNSRLFWIVLLMVINNPAWSAEPLDDRFKISLGGYAVSGHDSVMSLSDKGAGIGVSIVPEDILGLTTEQTVSQLDGYYRFSREHALTYSWYSINSTGYKSLEKDIDWLDNNGDPITITFGTYVTTSLEYDIFKVGYLWSFYHTDKVELAAGAGLHITRVLIGVNAETTSSGVSAQNVETTIPLPVVAFGLTYHVSPKWMWYTKSEFFRLSFDNWYGVYTDNRVGTEYRVYRDIGIGAAYGTNALKLIEDTSNHRFVYDNRITGLLVYVAGYF